MIGVLFSWCIPSDLKRLCLVMSKARRRSRIFWRGGERPQYGALSDVVVLDKRHLFRIDCSLDVVADDAGAARGALRFCTAWAKSSQSHFPFI
jgi:hypothetical protein